MRDPSRQEKEEESHVQKQKIGSQTLVLEVHLHYSISPLSGQGRYVEGSGGNPGVGKGLDSVSVLGEVVSFLFLSSQLCLIILHLPLWRSVPYP